LNIVVKQHKVYFYMHCKSYNLEQLIRILTTDTVS